MANTEDSRATATLSSLPDKRPRSDRLLTRLETLINDELRTNRESGRVLVRRAVRAPLPTLSSRRVSFHGRRDRLSAAVVELGLLDEPDPRRRLDVFLGYCRMKNYAYNTVATYVQRLRNTGLFDGNDAEYLAPCKIAFAETGKRHVRSVTVTSFARFVRYLNENITRATAPLLIAAYTGLRTSEILQFNCAILEQLRRRESPVFVERKNTSSMRDSRAQYWHPVFNSHLNGLIEILCQLFRPQCEQYEKHDINVALFPISRAVLLARAKTFYAKANGGVSPPHGFGVHSFRNMVAKAMSLHTDNIGAIQTWLQHKSARTTERYVNADYAYTAKQFDRLTGSQLGPAIELLRGRDVDGGDRRQEEEVDDVRGVGEGRVE